MIRSFLCLLLFLEPSLALAQEVIALKQDLVFERHDGETSADETFPAFYDVTRVEEDGHLTQRAGPSWDAERRGGPTYGLIDRNVEIVGLSANEGWGLTNYDYWLPMDFLTRKPVRIRSVRRDWQAPAEFPVRCEARSDNWNMTINPNGTYVYATRPGDRLAGRLTYVSADDDIYRYDYRAASDDGSVEVSLVITRELCRSGGRRSPHGSARGFSVDLAHESPLGRWHETACCRLVP